MLPNPNDPNSGSPVPVGPSPVGGMNGPAGPGGPQDSGGPDQIKQQLKMLLTKAKQIAEQNGVDFGAVVAEVEGNKTKSDVPLPRPPSPAGP